jgi:hypothetical protein
MRFLRNHNASVAVCYGCLATAKAVAGGFFEAGVYLAAAAIHVHAALRELRHER